MPSAFQLSLAYGSIGASIGTALGVGLAGNFPTNSTVHDWNRTYTLPGRDQYDMCRENASKEFDSLGCNGGDFSVKTYTPWFYGNDTCTQIFHCIINEFAPITLTFLGASFGMSVGMLISITRSIINNI